MKYLFLDVESGGLTTEYSLLTAYLAVYDEQLNLLDSLSLQMKPDDGVYNINPEALAVNKINLIEHNKTAITYKEAKTLLYTFLNWHSSKGADKLIACGHNVVFDIIFCTHFILSRNTWGKFISHHSIDTGGITQFLRVLKLIPIEVKGSLTSLAQHFSIDTSGAHDAKFDVEMCVAVFKKFLELTNGRS